MLSASVSGNTKVVNILSAAWRGCRELRAAAGIDKKATSSVIGVESEQHWRKIGPAVDPAAPAGVRC